MPAHTPARAQTARRVRSIRAERTQHIVPAGERQPIEAAHAVAGGNHTRYDPAETKAPVTSLGAARGSRCSRALLCRLRSGRLYRARCRPKFPAAALWSAALPGGDARAICRCRAGCRRGGLVRGDWRKRRAGSSDRRCRRRSRRRRSAWRRAQLRSLLLRTLSGKRRGVKGDVDQAAIRGIAGGLFSGFRVFDLGSGGCCPTAIARAGSVRYTTGAGGCRSRANALRGPGRAPPLGRGPRPLLRPIESLR
jgi:hypothetical protein